MPVDVETGWIKMSLPKQRAKSVDKSKPKVNEQGQRPKNENFLIRREKLL